ncbi:MAG: hypothetical protein DDT26_00093 [Dehalococcoidia bacterium]|nr:hypothetical protein [Chloroflexota bacterium]
MQNCNLVASFSEKASLGQRIHAARVLAGYRNLYEFAVVINLSASTLSRIERNMTEPSFEVVVKIALETQLPLGFFINEN